jgi:hypothetical protein
MATVTKDHRKHTADYPVPRGAWLAIKLAQSGQRGKAVTVSSVASVASQKRLAGGGVAPQLASTVTGTGSQPKGFGITVTWIGPEDLALTAFVTASDQLGFAVDGVTDADTFELVNAVGIASFAQDTSNENVSSIVTIVAAGAGIAAAAFGAPEVAPSIKDAGDAIAKLAPESKHPAKRRDPYGQNPATGTFEREEGGLLICSPAALGTYTSGNSDHEERWLKSHADRHPEHWPDHVKHAFFLERDQIPRTLEGNGEMIVCPWDYDFDDNTGSYRLDFILRRGQPSNDTVG